MNYKTLLAVHPTDDSVSTLKPIAAMARQFNAHLDVIILSALYPLPTFIVAENPNYAWSESLSDLTRKSEDRAQEISELLESENIEFTTDIEAQQVGQIAKAVAVPALTADLVVLNRNSSLLTGLMAQALEGALFAAGKPVLVLDDPLNVIPAQPDHVMIAWDGSREAAHAVHHGLGFLKCARSVHAFSIDETGKEEMKRGLKPLTRQLAHHGIKIESRRIPAEGRFTSHALIDHVNVHNPDLLIMGAYGHTRLRELIFSGVTRSALNQLKTPLLMAH